MKRLALYIDEDSSDTRVITALLQWHKESPCYGTRELWFGNEPAYSTARARKKAGAFDFTGIERFTFEPFPEKRRTTVQFGVVISGVLSISYLAKLTVSSSREKPDQVGLALRLDLGGRKIVGRVRRPDASPL